MKRIILNGAETEVNDDMTYRELAAQCQKDYEYPIVLAMEKERHKMRELFRPVGKNCTVEFLTVADKAGYETYKRSTVLLMLKAVSDVAGPEAARGIRVHFTVSEGFYCTSGNVRPDVHLPKNGK